MFIYYFRLCRSLQLAHIQCSRILILFVTWFTISILNLLWTHSISLPMAFGFNFNPLFTFPVCLFLSSLFTFHDFNFEFVVDTQYQLTHGFSVLILIRYLLSQFAYFFFFVIYFPSLLISFSSRFQFSICRETHSISLPIVYFKELVLTKGRGWSLNFLGAQLLCLRYAKWYLLMCK